jgi:hypothetical protein
VLPAFDPCWSLSRVWSCQVKFSECIGTLARWELSECWRYEGFPREPRSPISGPLWLTTIADQQRLGCQPGTRNSCAVIYISSFIKLLQCAVSTLVLCSIERRARWRLLLTIL